MTSTDRTKEVSDYVSKMLPGIAAYFTTTMGIPLESFSEVVENMNLAQQYLFVLQQVKEKHFI